MIVHCRSSMIASRGCLRTRMSGNRRKDDIHPRRCPCWRITLTRRRFHLWRCFSVRFRKAPTSVKAKIRTDYGLLATGWSSQETGSCTRKRGDSKYVRYRQICLSSSLSFFPTREHYESMWDYCSDPTSHLTTSPLCVKSRISMRWCIACTRGFCPGGIGWTLHLVFFGRLSFLW